MQTLNTLNYGYWLVKLVFLLIGKGKKGWNAKLAIIYL